MKKYMIPEELVALWSEHLAAIDLRDALIKSKALFVYNKLVRLSDKSQSLRQKFWNKVFCLYPELSGKQLRFDSNTGTVEALPKKEEIRQKKRKQYQRSGTRLDGKMVLNMRGNGRRP